MSKSFDESELNALLQNLDPGVHEFGLREPSEPKGESIEEHGENLDKRPSMKKERQGVREKCASGEMGSSMVRLDRQLLQVIDRIRLETIVSSGRRLTIKSLTERLILAGIKKEYPEIFKSLDKSLKERK